ncbi:MAG: hypothetical protein IJL91_05585 [Bacteroidales bacterium]|nr:hypothetical protein [Bacteroidales bacterium]
MSEENKTTWGGKREGSGRKSIGKSNRVTIGLSVPPEVKEKLFAKAKDEGISVSELITRIVESL